ncbi:putative transporter [Colletotrichum sp. SAR 10_65]|nr:putative transporter [Colletotrichum sp. SAR 10_65]
MVNDLRRRAPFYVSDWLDAWDYRVVPATVYMYFANHDIAVVVVLLSDGFKGDGDLHERSILPALAFSLDMFTSTGSTYGVNEVLLASVLGSVVFAVFACQPLVIVGVTGPITVFNYTVYDIMKPTGVNYLAFMCWIGIWSLILHWILAITNSCNWLRYVTRFPCDIFGFYVAFIYLQKGIQVLERLGDAEPFYLSIVASLLVFMVAYVCAGLGGSSLFHHHVRIFLKDYGTPLTLIFFTGFVHIGRMKPIDLEVLPTGIAFMPTADRGWLVHFWDIPVGDVFLALPFAILLTILFWFDHNVSSLIAQGTEFPLRKPAGFHWDLFLLGLTTGVAGILGLPFPNGLIPQAPFHTESLTVRKSEAEVDEKGELTGKHVTKASHVVEQRVSNLAQGLLTLGTMTGPLLVVLHLIPHGVLAGLFFVMGVQALEGNGITLKILFLLKDKNLTPPNHPLNQIRRRAVWEFVAIELRGGVSIWSDRVNSTISISLKESWSTSKSAMRSITKNSQKLDSQSIWLGPSGKEFYTWAGEKIYNRTLPDKDIWRFTADGSGGGKWERVTPSNPITFQNLLRPTDGTYTQSKDTGYYFGGIVRRRSDYSISDWNVSIPTPGLVSYNMTSGEIKNTTSEFGQFGTFKEGSSQFLPFGGAGVLLFLGGLEAPRTSRSGDWKEVDFTRVTLFDIEGVFDMTEMRWKDGYEADGAAYEPSEMVKQWYNEGGRDNVSWSSEDVKVLFSKSPQDNSTPPGPTSTPGGNDKASDDEGKHSSSPSAGAIAGGVIGGVLGMAILIFLAFFLIKRKKKYAATPQHPPYDPPNEDSVYQKYGSQSTAHGTQNTPEPHQLHVNV